MGENELIERLILPMETRVSKRVFKFTGGDVAPSEEEDEKHWRE